MNDFKLKYLIRKLMCGSHQNDVDTQIYVHHNLSKSSINVVTQTHILNKRYKGAHFTLVFFLSPPK